MENVSLHALFEQNKKRLHDALAGLTIPKDAQKVQHVISEHLSSLLLEDGDFRQHLTQSEDYILQAAMTLLSAQQLIARELTQKIPENKAKRLTGLSEEEQTRPTILKKEQCPIALGGTALGGAAGALIGTWATVFGAIAGTAIALYFTTQQNRHAPVMATTKTTEEPSPIDEEPINVDVFVNIVENICKSVDSLIDTFSAQVHRVVEKYESIQKPTLEGDYVELLENIQALLGAYAMDPSSDNRTKRIDQRIQFLEESLENYSLQSVVYDGNNNEMFNFQPSANVTEDTMVLPALVKDGKVVIKGKVFTKQ